MPISVVIADDHPLILSGLTTMLGQWQHITVKSTFSNGDDLLHSLQSEQPDIVLTDLQMPGVQSGGKLIQSLRHLYPDMSVIILSGQETIYTVRDAMSRGCKGYLLKNSTDPMMLKQAIEEVYEGKLFLEPSLKDELIQGIIKDKKEKEHLVNLLSRREKEILHLIAAGHTSLDIADKLFLSVRTVESHRLRLLQKLEVKNAVALLIRANELGLIV